MTDRITPLAPPYAPDIQASFDKIMPKGMPPLALFATLARDPRLWEKFRAGALLDQGHLTLRQREIVIHRVTALCGAEYEWGVHAVFFAGRARLNADQLRSTVHGDAEDPCWAGEDRPLIRACDALHATSTLDDGDWAALRSILSEDAVMEVLMLAGYYRSVSYLVNALKLPREGFAAKFPA